MLRCLFYLDANDANELGIRRQDITDDRLTCTVNLTTETSQGTPLKHIEM